MPPVGVHETLPGSSSYPKVRELQTRSFESSNFKHHIHARSMSPQYCFHSVHLHIVNNLSFMKRKVAYSFFHMEGLSPWKA